MPPEVEEGNVEYKLMLQAGNEVRLQHLTSQLKWRLSEHAECFYMLGVEDDGMLRGIYQSELDESLEVLSKMCSTIGAKIINADKQRVSRRPELWAAEVCIRLNSSVEGDVKESRRMVKVAFVGESNSGKSTLASVLSSGALDNGQGSLRLSMLRHRHEILSGRTSSVAVEFIPFDHETKQPIRVDLEGVEPIPLTLQKQLLSTNRVVQLVDTAGDVRYQKITFGALTTWAAPDWICVAVPATIESAAESEQTKDILSLVLSLELPFFVVINKIDLSESSHVMKLATEIPNLIVNIRKELFGVTIPPYAVSVLRVSCVDAAGIPNLINHFYRLHPRRNVRLMNYLLDNFPNASSLFCVEGVQTLPDVGIIVSGTCVYGSSQIGLSLTAAYMGPGKEGSMMEIKVKSAHRMRMPVHLIMGGQIVTLAVDGVPEDAIFKGMLIAFYDQKVEETCKFNMVSEMEIDCVGCTPDRASSIIEPLQGSLYWMGSRWSATLLKVSTFYGEIKMRANVKLTDSQAMLLPGTRAIFVGPNIRIQGFVYPPKE